jgi:hypothetical protein
VQSKMILALCAMLFTMCVLWTMAVPKPRPRTERGAPAASAPVATPARSVRLEHEGGLWSPAGFGLRLAAPADWRASRARGTARLSRDPRDAAAGQFELSARAVVGAAALDERLEALRERLGAQGGFELLQSAHASIGSREARRLEWRARDARGASVRSSALLWLSGPQELLLVFSAAEERWSELSGIGAAALASLELGPTSAPAIKRP